MWLLIKEKLGKDWTEGRLIECTETDTVEKVARLIASLDGDEEDYELLTLVYAGSQLEAGRQLQDYNLYDPKLREKRKRQRMGIEKEEETDAGPIKHTAVIHLIRHPPFPFKRSEVHQYAAELPKRILWEKPGKRREIMAQLFKCISGKGKSYKSAIVSNALIDALVEPSIFQADGIRTCVPLLAEFLAERESRYLQVEGDYATTTDLPQVLPVIIPALHTALKRLSAPPSSPSDPVQQMLYIITSLLRQGISLLYFFFLFLILLFYFSVFPC